MKIVGYTVGTTTPKPSFAQTDPSKGDYIKDKDALDDRYYTEDEIDEKLDSVNDSIARKSQVQVITSDASETLSILKIHKLTQEEYEQKLADGTLEDNAMYVTPDEEMDLSGYVTTEQLNDKADADHLHDALYDTKGSAATAEQNVKSYVDGLAKNYANKEHSHNDIYYTETEVDEKIDSVNDSIAQKSQVQVITSDASEVLSVLKIHQLTQEEYEQRRNDGTLEDNVLYITPDEEIVLNGYVTIDQLNTKADVVHNHDDIYYTEAEIDNKISVVNNSISTSLNEAKSYSDTNLNTAKTYADTVAAQRTQVQIITWEADD